MQNEKEHVDSKIAELNKDILELTSKLIPLDSTIEDIEALKKLKNTCDVFLSQVESSKAEKDLNLTIAIEALTNLEDDLKKYSIEAIQAKIDVLAQLHLQEKKTHGELERLKSELRIKLDKMKKLEDLKYDENCSFCMDNIFVKDAIATKASIESDKTEFLNLSGSLVELTDKIETLKPSLQEKESYYELQKKVSEAEKQKSKCESEIQDIKNKQIQVEGKLSEVKRLIEEYYKKEEAIKTNKSIKGEIDDREYQLDQWKIELSAINNKILSVHSEIIVAQSTKKSAEESIEKLKELTKQYKFYEYYLLAVSRDGVPYDLITQAVPYIEQEINNILSQLVDFNLMLEMDGKNINCHIVYDQDNFWPIELTSGMEKFISSLAIRTALINISSLPRPNFLAIDEGFGVLDSTNLHSMFNLFDYLKSQFSFMLVISHIDSMRDVVDKLIEITKINGNSNISYS